MTREERLWSMTARTLQDVGEKVGVKVTQSDIKKGKAKIIERILAAENSDTCADGTQLVEVGKEIADQAKQKAAEAKKTNEQKLVPMPGAEKLADLKKEVTAKPERKRGALIEYNGKSQNICAWAKELGKSANTLYSRIYILGWDVEKAFTYEGRKS